MGVGTGDGAWELRTALPTQDKVRPEIELRPDRAPQSTSSTLLRSQSPETLLSWELFRRKDGKWIPQCKKGSVSSFSSAGYSGVTDIQSRSLPWVRNLESCTSHFQHITELMFWQILIHTTLALPLVQKSIHEQDLFRDDCYFEPEVARCRWEETVQTVGGTVVP